MKTVKVFQLERLVNVSVKLDHWIFSSLFQANMEHIMRKKVRLSDASTLMLFSVDEILSEEKCKWN